MRATEFLIEEWSKKYKSSINCNDPKGFSQKAHCAGRKKNESITEAAKVGREYQHLEDLVFVDGSEGAIKAAEILTRLGQNPKDVSIKWDGRIAIYWGRDSDGVFSLVGKNGWGKNKSTSGEDLQNFITSSGKGEDWREKLGADMGAVFKIMEANTPADMRGFVFGDLLYHPGEPYTVSDSGIVFTPNQVTYTVDPRSSLGKRMLASQVGIAAHLYHENFGDTAGVPVQNIESLNSKTAVVLGPTYVAHQPKVDVGAVNQIVQIAKSNAAGIDALLDPRPGLSDMKQIIYTYVNQMSKAGKLKDLSTGFDEWLKSSKVSPQKQAKIMSLPEIKYLSVVFDLVLKIQEIKNSVIAQLDAASTDVKASINGAEGGEGYVAATDKIKLVPRHHWVPS